MTMANSRFKLHGTINRRVLEAMDRVPREQFVPPESGAEAYNDNPLPIGFGQTISQPYIVALMTDLLKIEPHHRLLEIGTGSGYQTAVLAQLAAHVYTVEIIPALGQLAQEKLIGMNYQNISYKIEDGAKGWPQESPFDGILVTAAAEEIPQHLINQLKLGGVMVMPLGKKSGNQQLLHIQKKSDGTIVRKTVCPVRFVPLTVNEP
jgi:protein-L-isoaspartate(D-aspartate) O-methyltransferase